MAGIEIQNCPSEDCTVLMAKGHVPDTDFLRAARTYWNKSLKGFEAPSHTYWRITHPDDDEYPNGLYEECTAATAGAFPVTVIYKF